MKVKAVSYTHLTINAFSVDDQIGLSLESTTAVTISPASDTSAYLNIVKIS